MQPAYFLFITILVVAASLVLSNQLPFARIEATLADVRISQLARSEVVDPSIVIVAITEESLGNNLTLSPIDRRFLARLITAIGSAAPASIGLDILFDRPTQPASDHDFGEALGLLRVPLVMIGSPRPAAFERAIRAARRVASPALNADGDDAVVRNFTERDRAGSLVLAASMIDATGHLDTKSDFEIRFGLTPNGDLPFRIIPAHYLLANPSLAATLKGQHVLVGGIFNDNDRHLTPLRFAWRTVLPVRVGGSELMTVATHANARPIIDLTVEADESDSTDVPSVFDAKVVIRGSLAAQIMLANLQFGEKERRQAIDMFLRNYLGEPQLSAASVIANAEDGTVTLTGRGVTTTHWYDDNRRRKRALTTVLYRFGFAPDRGRPAWVTVPVIATELSGTRFRLKLRLPDNGRGYTIDGEPNLNGEIAGFSVNRSVALTDGIVAVDERVEGTGFELTAAQIPAARDAFATATARLPIINAPLETRRRWDFGGTGSKGASQVVAAESIFTQAIANDPAEMTGYQSRASFRAGIGDRKGALADLSQAIKVEPSVELYLRRAGIAYELGDTSSALADAQAARALDPSSTDAIGRTAWYLAEKGELARGIALIDERIAVGGTTKSEYQSEKANLIGEWGDAATAIKLLDGLVADKPRTPSLLNARCWIKGIRNVMLDTALKYCTSAIELSENTIPMLDSRAMVWFRMGRFEDALRDIDTVLGSAPSIAQSRFLRGIVLSRLARSDEAAKELVTARRLDASIDRTNARYGIKP